MPSIDVFPPINFPCILIGGFPLLLTDNAEALRLFNAVNNGCIGLLCNDSSPVRTTSKSPKAATLDIKFIDVPELSRSNSLSGFFGSFPKPVTSQSAPLSSILAPKAIQAS